MTTRPELTEQHTRKGKTTRNRILARARTALIRNGLDAFSMRAVAYDLQIKLGNLQYYFPTRDELLREIIQLEAARDLRDMQTLQRANSSNKPDREALLILVHARVGRWRGDSGVIFSAR